MGVVTTIEWYEHPEQAGVPLAHVELIEMGLTLAQVQSLISVLQETHDEMVWFAAKWLTVSTISVNKSHILRKADYEQDKQHKASCGKLPTGSWNEHWEVTPMLGGPRSPHMCQVCARLYEKAQQH